MDGIHLVASAMSAAEVRIETAATNLANTASEAFRRRVTDVRMTRDGYRARVAIDPQGGAIKHTGHPLDLATSGDGHFFVGMMTPRGPSAVPTDSGHFHVDPNGGVVDELSRPLLGLSGPIRLNRAAVTSGAQVSFDARGSLSVNGDVIAQLVTTKNAVVIEGAVRESNVNAIHEMIELLEAQRVFETNQKTITAIDTVREKALSDVGTVQ